MPIQLSGPKSCLYQSIPFRRLACRKIIQDHRWLQCGGNLSCARSFIFPHRQQNNSIAKLPEYDLITKAVPILLQYVVGRWLWRVYYIEISDPEVIFFNLIDECSVVTSP